MTMKLTKLNDDNSWLWEFDGKIILVDPWFSPSQVDFYPWFSEQFHVGAQPTLDSFPKPDFIFISHPFTDHCNKETLLQMDASIPLIARALILKKIKKWGHFKHLILVENAPFKIQVLPPEGWLDLVHFAYLFENETGNLLFAPHGVKASVLPNARYLMTTTTEYRLPFWLGGTVNLGIKKGLMAQKKCGAEWLINTHDEKKRGTGFVEKFAKKQYFDFSYEAEKVVELKAGKTFNG